nr:putative catabolite repression protein crec [Quercus suber]
MPGGIVLLETQNTLAHPTGPEFQLVVGEGTYVLRDDLHLATPPPHPSDAPQPNNNPLATTMAAPTVGVKLSVAVLAPRKAPSQSLWRMDSMQSKSNLPHSIQEEAQSPKSDTGSTNGFGTASYYSQTPSFGDNNPAMVAPPLKGKKDQRVKPKNNIIKSNSSYVSRVIPHEYLTRRLAERSPEGLLVFANMNRSFLWLDLTSETKTENLTKILFTKANVLAHDINHYTKSTSHLDLVLGFNTPGDIIWYESMSQKYARINKGGLINATPVSSIKWLPHKENLFIAAHMDGSLIVYDKDREEGPNAMEETVPPPENGNGNGAAQGKLQVKKSVQSREQKTNPVAVWKLSNMKINDMAFSPDGQKLAVAGDDGCLSIIDYINEYVLDVFRSYYGAMLCVTWSPDGRYVLTGGQDDLVSIWSVMERALVARCVGHHSWVSDVKFDAWRCDERNYRFGSVGEDCRLLLWDFSVGMLGRPKVVGRHRESVSSGMRKESVATARVRSNSNLTATDELGSDDAPDEVVHAVDAKTSTAVLPPVMSTVADDHPLSWVGFEEHCIITACRDGHIREWDRPSESAAGDGVSVAGSGGSSQA